MDKRYEVFCLADRYFYETPDRLSGGRPGAAESSGFYEAAQRPVPDGWKTSVSGDWFHVNPVTAEGAPRPGRPLQGWKIHVSACLENAEKTAAKVWDYCVPREIPFKFVPTRHALHLRNSKYAGRGSSGKFATLYPADEGELHTVLRELGELLDGEPGPYILTDLRWHQGPLYVRYGGFAHRYCVDGAGGGALVPAIEDASGRLVPDRRDPTFHVPEWVTLPDFLEPHLAARNATTVGDLPYRIERALHFSNGGGVYEGRDTRTGERVVLKEARPHAGLASDGADAVARLERERTALERLSGLGVAPEVRDWFTLGDHRFLVMDHLPGQTLNSFFARRHPLLAIDPEPEAVADYTRWAMTIHDAVEEAVAAVHGRGVVFNDLHMFNIMVAPGERSVTLLDFEAAAHIGENRRQVIAHPGFIAPADRTGFEVDRYALACLRLALFVPMTSLLVVDRAKAAHLAEVAATQFPVDRAFLDEAVRVITGHEPGDAVPAAEPRARTEAVTRTATAPPTEAPGSAGAVSDGTSGSAIGTSGGMSGAAGAAPGGTSGAVGAASRGTVAAAPAPEPYLPVDPADWPLSRDSMARAIRASASPERDDRLFPGDVAQFGDGGGLGVAHGAAGVLYALDRTGAGRYEAGEEWLLAHTAPPPLGTPLGFYDGLAGVAHVLERLGHTERALELVDRVLAEKWQRLTPDLHGGVAGLGLAFDHLARATGESALADRAAEATRLLADRFTADEPDADARDGAGARRGGAKGRAGLLYGASGPALLFLRRYEHDRDPALLDLAAAALRRDLDRCVPDRHGTLLVDEGVRTMPYLGGGSVGIGMVLDSYLAHRADERLEAARAAITPAARLRYYAQPGLFNGRAGMVLHLSRTTTPGTEPAHLAAQAERLAWYGMPYQGHLAFPGDQMMRLSMDLGTGTAGCLLALGAARHTEPVGLPFLPPLRRPQSRPHPGVETE
ncbi:class III lanthionine synthetase LanKC [Streptomyces sp. SAJ15]|uniref:class III lanthionine synthetase LanKC n=1 Tax=Streptomyces sp. SAJ15 TaxID=2011095 RepID=UPI001185AE15|nr:class III lanthionine synthetase LanKC [Streptomyces sp. SAJ15]TVL90001.1 lantipeptide synthetase [Streptomyces sp. SAJ15]